MIVNLRTSSMLTLLVVLGLAAGPTASADTAKTVRHSGTVASIDAQSGVLAIDEVGPWRVEHGATITTRRNIVFTPETRFDLYMRVDAPGAFAGDFMEVKLAPEDVSPGDFVTAECVRRNGRLEALTITVAERGTS